MKNILYGDGIRDDAPAIQELLDQGLSEVALPVPAEHYAIGTTLRIRSGQTLRLGATTEIRLLPGSSCYMIRNAEPGAHDIALEGGIWDYNNKEQAPNPYKNWDFAVSHWDGKPDTVCRYREEEYSGCLMHFCGVKRLSLRNLTLKDPVTYSLQLSEVEYFTVENIFFDQNDGNPSPENMDGIHLDGGCRFGTIRDVKGTCYDDMVALNCDDNNDGPIEDILIDGVFGEHSLRGIRLLSTKSSLTRISVSNVFGTFYQNAVSLSYFYPFSGLRGQMEFVSIKNVFAEQAPRLPEYGKKGPHTFSLIWIDKNLDIGHLEIDGVFRREHLGATPTLAVRPGTKIRQLSVSDVTHRNETGTPVPAIVNEGEIGCLSLRNIVTYGDVLLENRGTVEERQGSGC